MNFELREYQRQSVDRVLSTADKIIECAPTGSGKTVIQAFIAKAGLDNGERTALLTPRGEIFDQSHGVLGEVCGHHNIGTLRAGHSWDQSKKIHVVSWPTLTTRMKKSMVWLPDADRVLVDEVHLAMAPEIGKVLEYYAPRAHVVGFSATPARKTGKGLGTYFNAVNIVTTVRQLIDDGHLCRNEYWGGSLPDLKGIRTQQGDYATGQLSERVALLVGDVVDNWLRLASDRQTIVFAVDIAHAEALMDRFLEVGVRAVAVHTRMNPDKRDRAVQMFRSGQIQLVVNVGILTYGFDAPSVSCIVAARPTKSLVLWLQMLGRGMRPFLGKDHCMVLDHADNTRTLGYAEDLYQWELDDGESGVTNTTKEEKEKRAEQTYTCEKCTYMFSGTRECPRCGFEIPFAARDVSTVDADLVPIGKNMLKILPEGYPDHQNFYLMLRHYAANAKKPKDSKWAWYRYKEKVGVGPLVEWKDMALVPPTQRVKGYIQKGNIAYAKGRGKMRSRVDPGQRAAV